MSIGAGFSWEATEPATKTGTTNKTSHLTSTFSNKTKPVLVLGRAMRESNGVKPNQLFTAYMHSLNRHRIARKVENGSRSPSGSVGGLAEKPRKDRGGETRTPDLLNPIQMRASSRNGRKRLCEGNFLKTGVLAEIRNFPKSSHIVLNRPGFVRTKCVQTRAKSPATRNRRQRMQCKGDRPDRPHHTGENH